jgi:GxxExxY protein
MKVHSALGPGLLESAYEACLLYELHKSGLKAAGQVPLPVIYESVKIDVGYRIDILVEGAVVVELKSVSEIAPVLCLPPRPPRLIFSGLSVRVSPLHRG